MQQGVKVGELVEHQVRNESAVPVWGAVADVAVGEGGLLEDTGAVECELVVQIRVGPQALDLAAGRVGQVGEHADEDEGVVAFLCQARWGDGSVQSEWRVVQLRVEGGIVGLD